MRAAYAALLDRDAIPQTEPSDATQVRNSAGGYVYAVTDRARLDRFLVLGSESPTYYQSARKLTRENAASVLACYAQDPEGTVARIVEISTSARAPRVSPAIFALALGAAHPDVKVRRAALAALPEVCRTASHLFEFVAVATALGRGWGRTLKRAVADWYARRDVDALALQAVKYRARSGLDHSRLLRTAHPRPADDDLPRKALYRWMARPSDDLGHLATALPGKVTAHVRAMAASDPGEVAGIVREHGLPWEAVPTSSHGDVRVWEALLPHMGATALLRNLGRLTRLGFLAPLSAGTSEVVARLGDHEAMRRARVHPFAILTAAAAYKAGRPLAAERRGPVAPDTCWTPVPAVVDALDRAFYAAFANVVPSGRRHLLALDVSGSMDSSKLMDSALSAREGAAAMALVTMATEPSTHVVAFSTTMLPLDVSPRMRLDQVLAVTRGLPFQGTDCSLPMLYALERRMDVDTFVVYTDNETWAGRTHPKAALARYRRETGIPAKLAVVGMTSTGFSIADPGDAGMMDFVGFDASAPALLSDFGRG